MDRIIQEYLTVSSENTIRIARSKRKRYSKKSSRCSKFRTFILYALLLIPATVKSNKIDGFGYIHYQQKKNIVLGKTHSAAFAAYPKNNMVHKFIKYFGQLKKSRTTSFSLTSSYRTNKQKYQNHSSSQSRSLLSATNNMPTSSSSISNKHTNINLNLQSQTDNISPFSSCRDDKQKTDMSTSATTSKSSFKSTDSSQDSGEKKYTLYEELIRKLYMTNLFNPVKLGLDNTFALHEAIGSPIDNPDITIVHVAGTNGKGSVALKIARTYELAGHKTGLFVSPHVSSFRERMSVNGKMISEEEVCQLLPELYKQIEEKGIAATYFEITTCLAFLFFATRGVDVIVLETGLGGRLDATNIVRKPALSIITSIGLEHTRILGDTKELIALEKGGIIKEGRPVLVGPEVPMKVLRQCAKEKKASAFYTCEDILGEDESSKSFKNAGDVKDYDKENARIARAALQIVQEDRNNRICDSIRKDNETNLDPSYKNLQTITENQIELGTSQRPPCRFEVLQVLVDENGAVQKRNENESSDLHLTEVKVILDVAHNPPAMQHLVSKLENTFPTDKDGNRRFVAGFSSDKNLSECAQHLINSCNGDVSRIHIIEASHPRAASIESILEACPDLFSCQNNSEDSSANYDKKDRSLSRQIKEGLRLASKYNEILVVCGSVFIMAEAREALGIDEPKDSDFIAEVAGAGMKTFQENFGEQNKSDLSK